LRSFVMPSGPSNPCAIRNLASLLVERRACHATACVITQAARAGVLPYDPCDPVLD